MFDFEAIKTKLLSYDKFVKNYFKENGKNIQAIKNLEKELFEKEFGEEVSKYDIHTNDFDNYINLKEDELNEIENKKREEKSRLDTVTKKIRRNLELLEEDNISLEEINSDLTEYRNTLLNFGERFSNSANKIDELIEGIVKYETFAKDDINETIEKSKKEIQEYFDAEKENIINFLEEKSKIVIEEKFNTEQLKLDEEKKEAFYFDGKIFFKYILIFLLSFGIATIDFLLVQHIVVEEFDLGRNADNSTKILVNYIIPFLPSFVLIFGEFLVIKYLRHNKILKSVVHIFSFISIVFIIFTVFFTYQDYTFSLVDNVNMYDLLSRILIFVIAIPITIAILNKFFKSDEFFDFLRHLFLPLIFIFIFSKYFIESFILRKKKNNLFKEAFTYELNLDKLDLFMKKDHKLDDLFSIPRTFNEDLNQISIKTEKALSNIKTLQAFLSKDDIEVKKIGFWKRLFLRKNNDNNIMGTLNGKIERLKHDIKSIGKNIEEQEEIIDKKFEQDIDNVNVEINQVKEKRKTYKKNYITNKKNVEDAISEALIILQK